MAYIFGAYAAIFGIIGLYLVVLRARQRTLEKELENVKRVVERNH